MIMAEIHRLAMHSPICLFFMLLLSSQVCTKEIYREIYPPLGNEESLSSHCNRTSNPEGTCPLFIGFLTSFGGIYKGSGVIPGVQLALDEINKDPNILPGYTLHYALMDSNVSCYIRNQS